MKCSPARIADFFAEVEKRNRRVVEIYFPNEAHTHLPKLHRMVKDLKFCGDKTTLWGAHIRFFNDPESVFLLDDKGEMYWFPYDDVCVLRVLE